MNPALFSLFRSVETRVHELNYLFWECTTRCNLHCRHCGSDCSVQSREQDMPLEDFLAALDTIPHDHRPEGFTVVLTGGEPLLRPDILECGRAIRERGFGWSMVSNGYFYDASMHQALLEAGLGALTISLDGLEEEHDWMRGHKGSFKRAVGAISLAASCAKINFDVVTCVCKRNLGLLPQMYELLSGLGVRQWRLFTIIPIGRAANDPLMRLSQDEVVQMMEFIRERRAAGGDLRVSFSCEGYLGPYEQVVRDAPFFCRAGINIASVLIDGRICACPNIDRDVFSEGSIYEDNFYEVWQKGFGRMRDRSWARRGECERCKVFRRCQGGGMHNWHGALEGPLDCLYAAVNR